MTAENKKRKESRFLHRLLVCLFTKMHHHMLRLIDDKNWIIGIAFVQNYGNKKGKKKYISLFKDIQLYVDKSRKESKRNQRPDLYRSQFKSNLSRHKNIFCELKKNNDKTCIPFKFYQLKNVPDEVIQKAEKEARDILSGKLKQCDMGLDIDMFEPSPLDKEVEEIFEKETSIILNYFQEHNNSDASSDEHNEVSNASSEGNCNMLNSIAYNTQILDTLGTFVSSEEKNKTLNNSTCNIYLLVVVQEGPKNLTASVKDTSMQGINDTPVVRKLKRPADVTTESDQLSPAKRQAFSPQARPSWCPDSDTAIREVMAQEELKNLACVPLKTASVKDTSMQGINNVGQEELKNLACVPLKTASVEDTSMQQEISDRPVEVLQLSQDPFLWSAIGDRESDNEDAPRESARIIEKQREEQRRSVEEDVHASEDLYDITGLTTGWFDEFIPIIDLMQKYEI